MAEKLQYELAQQHHPYAGYNNGDDGPRLVGQGNGAQLYHDQDDDQARRCEIRRLVIASWVIWSLIVAACCVWVLWWFVSSEPGVPPAKTAYVDRIQPRINSKFFRTDGNYGSVLLYQAIPFIVVALLSFAIVELRTRINKATNMSNAIKRRSTRPSIVTYPVWVRSPLGVLTGVEVLFILAILLLVAYSFGRLTYLRFENYDNQFRANPKNFQKISLSLTKWGRASRHMAKFANIPFSLLWIPVSRGSPFLRLIKLPFEHAVKYHIWLATLTLSMLSFHGVGYMVYYGLSQQSHKIVEWDAEGEECAVVAGVVALSAGLVMWVTSLAFFRRRWYELFFGIHHLYIVFVVFWLYHFISSIHFFIVPVFLFMVDRFLRMLQSRRSVDVLSARILDSGAMELKLARNTVDPGFEYHALSSWYLRFPSLSQIWKFQWHFFSVTSTPFDEKPELSIVIKPLGGWTKSLQKQLMPETSARCPFSFKAGVEGPYGDETDFYLKYPCLVLIGGGIGVTPLLAILRDVLHRLRLQKKTNYKNTNLPTSIQLYHCVRTPEELCVLNSVDPNKILPGYQKQGLQIQVHAYITSPLLALYKGIMPGLSSTADGDGQHTISQALDLATFPVLSHENKSTPIVKTSSASSQGLTRGVSSIGSKGQTGWVACTVFASLVGFYIFWGLSNVLIMKGAESHFPNYSRVHLIVASMLLGTTLFGGLVVAFWYSSWISKPHGLITREAAAYSSKVNSAASPLPPTAPVPASQAAFPDQEYEQEIEIGSPKGSPWDGTLHLRERPHWKEIFAGLAKQYAGENVGVLVSGSQSMQEDVARECRRHTRLLDPTASTAIFHYHSVSFEL